MLPPVTAAPLPADEAELSRALAYLASFTDWEQLKPAAAKPFPFGLERMQVLARALGHPERTRPAIHITGTKGKSGTARFASAILTAHGARAFHFISPHVERVTERLSIDGRDITGGEFAALADQLRPHVEQMRASAPELVPTFFEALTAMGFLHALVADASVLEVGLGGRLDATNIVQPVASIITSIGLDHTQILGSTHDAVAFEKAGIVKRGVPLLLGLHPGDQGFATIAGRAVELGAPLLHVGRDFVVSRTRLVRRDTSEPQLAVDGIAAGLPVRDLLLPLGSRHQALNALLALAAAALLLRRMGREFDLDRARAALATASLPARAEWFPDNPPVLLDGAHTRESVAAIFELAQQLAAGRPVHALVGLTLERDPVSVFAPLVDAASVTTTTVPGPRGQSAADLAEALGGHAIESPLEALAAARREARGGVLLVTGSLYLAGALRSMLTQEVRRPLS